MSKKEITSIKEVIKILKETDCSFWGCEGPESGKKDPLLCNICYSIGELQKLIQKEA